MIQFDNKDKINTLLNIDNYFGEYSGRMAPMLIFFAVAATPLLGWLFMFQIWIPFKWFVVPWLLWCGRWALIILGKEKQKLEFYDKQRADEYKSANELLHITHIHENGLIEYDNSYCAFIISAMPKGFISDARLSVELENFYEELDHWDWDIYMHNAVGEVTCKSHLPNLAKYTDKQVISERIEFYTYQDEYSNTHSGLYRYNYLVKTSKYNWKKLQLHLTELISSELCKCFNEVYICNREQVNDVINRDLCAYVDLFKMLTTKYDNADFHNSKVLWYDEQIPDNLKSDKVSKSTNLANRRVTRK